MGCYLSQIFCKFYEQGKELKKIIKHVLPKKRSNDYWQWKVEKKFLGSAQKFRVGHVIGNTNRYFLGIHVIRNFKLL